jgi:hypothetical protein
MLSRYNIIAARDLEEGVARLAEYLNRAIAHQNGTKRDQSKMVELNGIEPSTS